MLNEEQKDLVIGLLEVELETSLDMYHNENEEQEREDLMKGIRVVVETLNVFNYEYSPNQLRNLEGMIG